MSKAQTDIRSTSYDIHAANSRGYVGTIEDVLWQVACEEEHQPLESTRELLLVYLGVNQFEESAGPSLELDENPRYGDEPVAEEEEEEEEPPFFSLAYAEKRGFFKPSGLTERLRRLSPLQQSVYKDYRECGYGVRVSLEQAEAHSPIEQDTYL